MLPPPCKRRFAAAAGGGGCGEGGPALLSSHDLGSYAQIDQPGHYGGGQGDDGFAAALLDVLGLGSFARLDLPAPPDGLDLTAAVDPCSGGIIVSLGGVSIVVSPLDLSTALSLPLGTVALPAEVDPAVFSSVEAIAAVRAFVHDRLMLGGTADFHVLPEETVAALQLVEDGKAYSVDWGWFVWAFLTAEVLIGNPQRCSGYLIRLIKLQRPDLFSQVDGRFLGGLILQQQQQEILLLGNGGYDMAAEAQAYQDGFAFGLNKNIGELDKMPAFGYVKDQQHTIGTADQQDGNNVNVGPSSVPSFLASGEQILANLSNMEHALWDKETTLTHTRAEIQHMKEEAKEKDNQIAYLLGKTQQELQARATKMRQLKHDKVLMSDMLHGCKKMLHESSAAFLEYREMTCEATGVSSLDDVADEKSQARLLQQQRRAHEIINGFQKTMLPKFVECTKKIAALFKKIKDLNDEVQRLKDPRSLIDLGVGLHQ